MTIGFRTYSELLGRDRSDLVAQVTAQREKVRRRLELVERCVAVMSGKGGVGKSFVAALLAAQSARAGARVGLLDADLHGPTAARLSGVSPGELRVEQSAVVPAVSPAGVRVMSMELLLEAGRPLAWKEPASESFVWRGAQEQGALREFLGDVEWGKLDLLLIDLPPGTGRMIDLAELVPDLSGTLVVTIPSDASRASVERSLREARERGMPALGVIENMSGYACPECGAVRPLFRGDAGESLAGLFGIPLLGRVPLDPESAALAEKGDPLGALDRPAGRALATIAATLLGGEEAA
ncbi:MAG: P-loop NTPase [Gemmatimonadota bacterium]